MHTLSQSQYDQLAATLTKPVIDGHLAEIAKLPQYAHIKPENMFKWLEAIASFDAPRIGWHIKRLYGIGGSEIGKLMHAAYEKFNPFGSAYDIYTDKLMITHPSEPNHHMSRGTNMEDHIGNSFRRQANASTAKEAIATFSTIKIKDHFWLNGNPDDLVYFGSDYKPENGLWLVDYKAPDKEGFIEKYDKEGVNFDYVCQLHHYRACALQAGSDFKIKGLLLVSWDKSKFGFDLSPEGLSNLDLDVRQVPFDADLHDNMLKHGDALWSDIVNGRKPSMDFGRKTARKLDESLFEVSIEAEPDQAIRMEMATEKLNLFQSTIEQSSAATLLANMAYTHDKAMKKSLNEMAQGLSMDESNKISYGISSIKTTAVVNEDLLDSLLDRLNIDKEAVLKTSTEFDAEKIDAYLLALPSIIKASLYKRELDEGALLLQVTEKLDSQDDAKIAIEKIKDLTYALTTSRAKVGFIAECIKLTKSNAERVLADFIEESKPIILGELTAEEVSNHLTQQASKPKPSM